MFKRYGWTIADRLRGASLVQFTGGSDVTPKMYGERPHPLTHCQPQRDAFEAAIFQIALLKGLPMAGICRGGQFLNVMCGGSMWQDVDKHGISYLHPALDTLTDATVMVSSTHHQMMKPSLEAEILLTAHLSTRKERMGVSGILVQYSDDEDVEACFYKSQKALCFQPHPEMYRPDLNECREVYFNYIEMFLGVRSKGGWKDV